MTIFKNIKYLTLLSFILLVEFSCSDDLPKTKSEQVAEVLEVDTEASELIDFSSRGSWSEYDKPNPIEALFKEALKNNEELRTLVEQSNKINTEPLDKFVNYSSINVAYWQSVQNELNHLKDTVLRDKVKLFFHEIEKAHQEKLTNHFLVAESLYQKKEQISDQLVLLKLAIAQPMMATYQQNELVELEKLRETAQKYDSLITVLEKKTKSIR